MKRLTILSIAFLIGTTAANAQDVVGDQTTQQTLNLLSPQTFEFAKQGGNPISYFSGESGFKVPVYKYQDRDFNIPINLGYSSGGFSPNKRDGIVGLNWFISGGGVITRQVHGVADERAGMWSDPTSPLAGLYWGIKNSTIVPATSKDNIFNLTVGDVPSSFFWNIDHCEVEPDDFTFNGPGLEGGRFFIENTGAVRTIGNKPYKIDLSNFATQAFGTGKTLNNSSITITADNGYIYYYGADPSDNNFMKYLEVSYSWYQTGIVSSVITAWHLRKITAPNGRSVVFDYYPFTAGFNGDLPLSVNSNHYLMTRYNSQYSNGGTNCNQFPGPGGAQFCSQGGINGTSVNDEFTKTAYLNSITVDGVVIQFQYTPKPNKFYTFSHPYNQNDLQLDAITVTSGTTLLHTYNFKYKPLGQTFPRYFLTSFQEQGGGSHEFTYNKVAPSTVTDTNLNAILPDPNTNGVDFWGYWNGGAVNGYLVPSASLNQNGDVTYTSSERNPDATKSSIGMLQQVTYPTGGYSKFYYEGHQYGNRLDRRSDHAFLPWLYTETGYAGGVRIQQIDDFDGSQTTSRQFKYVTNFTTSGTTPSGILMTWPRYIFFWHWDTGTTNGNALRINSSNYLANHYPGEGNMQYAEVSEVRMPSNGCITYKFTSYADHPDLTTLNTDYSTKLIIPVSTTFAPNNLYNNYIGIKMADRSIERGKPTQVATYKSVGSAYTIIERNDFTYTPQSTSGFSAMYSVGTLLTGGLVASYKLYYYPFLPITQTTTSYSTDATPSATLTTTAYNSGNFVQSRTVTGSDGISRQEKFTYPSDFVADADDAVLYTGAAHNTPTAIYTALTGELKALADMKKANILNRPIENIKYVNNAVVESTYIEYKDFQGIPLSKQIYPYRVWPLRTASPISGFTQAAINKTGAWTFSKSSSYDTDPKSTFNSYDTYGNLTQVTARNKLVTSYLWGYGNLYQIATGTGISGMIYYDGFEGTNGTADTNSKAGRKMLTSTTAFTFTGLTAGNKYVLSYWQRSGSVWSQVPTTITASGTSYSQTITASGSSPIDELRFYDARTMMTSYTHDPFIGITSKEDPRNIFEFYEYDLLGRLHLVRDFNRDVVRMTDYAFKVK